MSHRPDHHELVFDSLRSGVDPRFPKADTLRVAPGVRKQLREANALGLLDTLVAIAGRQPAKILTLRPTAPTDVIGYFESTSTNVEIAPDITPRMAIETLAHEFGHFIQEKTRGRVPILATKGARRGFGEAGARPFSRAVLALRVLARDTAGAENITRQFEMGIHPLLSILEMSRGQQPGTERIIGELLSLPIYAKHPLQPHRRRLLREGTLPR